MIVRDGICYADSLAPVLKIVAAENVGDYLVGVWFDNGRYCLFDGRNLEGDVFRPLKDPKIFSNWTLDSETLTWQDGEIDIAPEYVLDHSTDVPENARGGSCDDTAAYGASKSCKSC